MTNNIKLLFKEFSDLSIDDLYASIGSGEITALSVIKKIYPEYNYVPVSKFNENISGRMGQV